MQTVIQWHQNSFFFSKKLQKIAKRLGVSPPRQARRQDSMTGGGAEINFGGAREVYLCEFKRGTGAQEIYSSVDHTNKVKTKKKRSSVQNFPQILVIVSKFLRFFTNS